MTVNRVTLTGAYVEVDHESEAAATFVGAYVEVDHESEAAATFVGAYVETTGDAYGSNDEQTATSVVGLIELDGDGDAVSATNVGAEIEIEGDGDSVSATNVAGYVETEGDGDAVSATNVGSLVEFVGIDEGQSATNVAGYVETEGDGDAVSATSLSAYLETEALVADFVSATSVTALVEQSDFPAKVIISKIVAELVVEDAGAYVSQMALYVEYEQSDVYITQFGVMVEIDELERDVPTYFEQRTAGPQSLLSLSPEVVGYALDPSYSFWQIIVPKQAINYVENPSFENGLEDYSSTGWTVEENPSVGTRAGSHAARLYYDLTPRNIQYMAAQSVPAGIYTFSCWVWTEKDFVFTLDIYNGGVGEVVAAKEFKTQYTGWHRYEVTGVSGAAFVFRCRLNMEAAQTRGQFIYTDGWQFEEGKEATTYFDGDFEGFTEDHEKSPYYWMGTPHNSESIRLGTTRSGGAIRSLSEHIRFLTVAVSGLGMSPIELDTSALTDGTEVYRGAFFRSRTFTITGRLYGKNFMELEYNKSLLMDYLKPDLTEDRQPLIIRYAPTDLTGDELVRPVEIVASYRGGMEGNITNWYTESIPLQFFATVPRVQDLIRFSANIGFKQEFAAQNVYMKNTPTAPSWSYAIEEGWFDFGGGVSNISVLDIALRGDGFLIACGSFSQLNGWPVDQVAEWNIQQQRWDELNNGSGFPAFDEPDVIAYGKGPQDQVPYAGGYFTTHDGNTCRGIAVFERTGIAAWSELGTGIFDAGGGGVRAITTASNGDVFAFGEFTHEGAAVTAYNNAIRYDNDAAAWAHMGVLGNSGLNGVVFDSDMGPDGKVYVCGEFTDDMSGSFSGGLNLVARWNPFAEVWEALGEGLPASVAATRSSDIAVARDGTVYVTCNPTGASLSQKAIYKWTGSAWIAFKYYTLSSVYELDVDADNRLHVTGSFFEAADDTDLVMHDHWYTIISGNVNSNGGLTQQLDDSPYGVYTQPSKIITDAQGRIAVMMFGVVNDNNVHAEAQTTITNTGSTEAWPSIHITGPGEIRVLRNATTGAELQFRGDFLLGDSEVLTIDLSGQRPKMYSNIRSDVQKFLLPGVSSIRKWRLLPGDNMIECLIIKDDITTDVWMEWRNNYWSIASSGGFME